MKANGRGNGALALTRRSPPPGHGAAGLLTLSTFSRGHERNYQHNSPEKNAPAKTQTQAPYTRAHARDSPEIASGEVTPSQRPPRWPRPALGRRWGWWVGEEVAAPPQRRGAGQGRFLPACAAAAVQFTERQNPLPSFPSSPNSRGWRGHSAGGTFLGSGGVTWM